MKKTIAGLLAALFVFALPLFSFAEQSSNKEIIVHIDGKKMLMSRDIEAKNIPAGFTASDVSYNSQNVEVAINGNLGLTLAYITDEDDENGRFYCWDIESGVFSPILQYSGEWFILPLPDTLPNEMLSYEKSEIILSAGNAECLDIGDGYYVLYAENGESAEFMIYEATEGSLQRFHEISHEFHASTDDAPKVEIPEKQANSPDFISVLLYIAIALAGILAIILIIVVSIRLKRARSNKQRGY